MPDTAQRTLGVEEEFHVVDPVSRRLVPDGPAVLAVLAELDRGGTDGGAAVPGRAGDDEGQVSPELQRSAVETATAVCSSLAELRREVGRMRRRVVEAADSAGRSLLAAGTAPLVDWAGQSVSPGDRYQRMGQRYSQTAVEQLVCGCQTQVGVPDREVAVQVLDRVRPWLPTLLALSASSPFWDGDDTGYSSWRAVVWSRWPSSGIPGRFGTPTAYDAVRDALIGTGTLVDAGMVYFDVRLSARYPTVEFRIGDACPTVDEAVLQAGLAAALVATARAAAERGDPVPDVRDELLRSAKWRASRSGLDGDLVDETGVGTRPAREQVGALLTHLRPALEDVGDWAEVSALAGAVLAGGGSAVRQRAALARRGRVEDVVDLLVAETRGS